MHMPVKALMAISAAIMLAGASAAAPPPAPDARAAPSTTERNRSIMREFVDIFYRQRDVRRAFETYVAPDYIQHNPGAGDGRDAAVTMLTPLFSGAGARFEVKRIIVDGDLAVVHLHGRPNPAVPGVAVADIYRLRDGKIVEHWDVLQPIPKTAANAHPMF